MASPLLNEYLCGKHCWGVYEQALRKQEFCDYNTLYIINNSTYSYLKSKANQGNWVIQKIKLKKISERSSMNGWNSTCNTNLSGLHHQIVQKKYICKGKDILVEQRTINAAQSQMQKMWGTSRSAPGRFLALCRLHTKHRQSPSRCFMGSSWRYNFDFFVHMANNQELNIIIHNLKSHFQWRRMDSQ